MQQTASRTVRHALAAALLTTLATAPIVQASPLAKAKPLSKEVQQQLIHAVLQDQIETVPTLLAKGGDPNARVVFGKEDAWYLQGRPGDDPSPPLFLLACRFGSIKGPLIIAELIKHGADVNRTDRNGVTPLMAASELGGSVSLLLEHGARANVQDRTGKTPLMYAMNNRGLSIAANLLAHGANINAVDAQGTSALMLAITNAIQDPVLLYGEDLVQKEKVAKQSYRELIGFLIDKGADVNAKNKAGTGPMKLAEIVKQPEIVAMLKQAGAK
jgi:ankyrin repeat protein